ncbi:MAG TPA: phosphoenolpyruvate carboxykinase (ATP) [Actinomycetota bacterium]|nr:phosphoenolpyruvate carboxykinase (ATP) [Actinomycetota bacterium]
MTPALTADAGLRAGSVRFRPSEGELAELTDSMPAARRTRFGNVNVRTRVQDRLRSATFVVDDRPDRHPGQPMGRAEGALIAAVQDAYIESHDMVVVDGFIGHAGPHRTLARLVVERANAGIAGMQRHLYYDPVVGDAPVAPELTVICTPNLGVPGYPDGRVVAVWPEEGVTRIVGSDYFGEAKKAVLRMWSWRFHDAGGLVMHAACKVVPTARGPRTMLIVGRSGTGKSTTTFTCHNGSRVVQDDFVGLLPGGRIVPSEDGCIEKTYGLDPLLQPLVHAAATGPDAYLENVSQQGEELDFLDPTSTRHGRAVFNLRSVDRFPPDRVPPASILVILNRDEHVTPAVARIDPSQAARHYLLREIHGPAADGRQESGGRRGSDPLALEYARHGNRLAELLRDHPMEVFLVNTGRVGGPARAGRSKAIAVSDTSAVVAAVAEGTIAWDGDDPDLGCEVAADVPGIDDRELYRPSLLYRRQGRLAEYRSRAAHRAATAAWYLAGLPGLDPEVSGGSGT